MKKSGTIFEAIQACIYVCEEDVNIFVSLVYCMYVCMYVYICKTLRGNSKYECNPTCNSSMHGTCENSSRVYV